MIGDGIPFDLLILDIMMPGPSGLDICRDVRSRSAVPIIVLTAKDAEVDKVVGLEVGADDYVTKPFSVRELLGRVRAQLRRRELDRSPLAQAVKIQSGPVSIDLVRHVATVRDRPVNLTRSEFQLLRLLVGRPGEVFSRAKIMEELWQTEFDGDERPATCTSRTCARRSSATRSGRAGAHGARRRLQIQRRRRLITSRPLAQPARGRCSHSAPIVPSQAAASPSGRGSSSKSASRPLRRRLTRPASRSSVEVLGDRLAADRQRGGEPGRGGAGLGGEHLDQVAAGGVGERGEDRAGAAPSAAPGRWLVRGGATARRGRGGRR